MTNFNIIKHPKLTIWESSMMFHPLCILLIAETFARRLLPSFHSPKESMKRFLSFFVLVSLISAKELCKSMFGSCSSLWLLSFLLSYLVRKPLSWLSGVGLHHVFAWFCCNGNHSVLFCVRFKALQSVL